MHKQHVTVRQTNQNSHAFSREKKKHWKSLVFWHVETLLKRCAHFTHTPIHFLTTHFQSIEQLEFDQRKKRETWIEVPYHVSQFLNLWLFQPSFACKEKCGRKWKGIYIDAPFASLVRDKSGFLLFAMSVPCCRLKVIN